jgi:hypothetical protein
LIGISFGIPIFLTLLMGYFMNIKTKNKKINSFLNVFNENKKLLNKHNEIVDLLFKISLLLNNTNNQNEIKITLDRFLFESLNNK